MIRENIKTVVAALAGGALVFLLLRLQEPSDAPDSKQTALEVSLWINTLQLRHAEERGELMETLIQERPAYVPILVQQMAVDESAVKQLLRRAVNHLPEPARGTFDIKQSSDVHRAGASWGLLYLLRGRDNFGTRATAEEVKVLLPALRNALRDDSLHVRLNAAACLGAFDPAAPEVRQLLLKALGDKNSMVRYNAAYALWGSLREEQRVRRFLDENLSPQQAALRAETLQNFTKVSDWHSGASRSQDRGPFDFE